jgi:hypothetical protein
MDTQNEYNYAREQVLSEKMVNNYQKDELFATLESNNLGILINVFLKSDLHKKVVFDLINESELYEGETIKEKLFNLIFCIEGNGAINTLSELTYYNDSDKIFDLYQSDISDYIDEKDEQDGYAKDVLRHIISDDMLLTESYTRNRVLGFIYESIANDIKVILEY